MKVSDVMTSDVKVININDSIRKAAQMMRDQDCGSLPVESDDKLCGMITDRDITLWVAESGNDSPMEATVAQCMSEGIKYCFDDEDVEDIAQNMADEKIRRLPVVDREKNLVGIVSLGDLAQSDEEEAAFDALKRISS